MEDHLSIMAAAKMHVEKIRKEKFSIGVAKNPLSKSLSMAVTYLSAELYSKDVHFLMELIQNAEDNEYLEGVEPSLEFLITSRDVTGTGAPATLMVFNNEKGFSQRNIESICSVGDSTKAGNRKRGYIGEKGIGFKSVFLLTAEPYIFSNGYQIRFSEKPCAECDVAYIVPEWVDNKPCVSEIRKIYGSRTLPTTTLILPLKADKVKAVKQQLSSLHPELLLFLSKIKRLSVKEDNENPALSTIRAISISSERDFESRKSIDAESYTVHLAAEEGGEDLEGECRYYMWKQRFPVRKENKVEKRMDIEEWAITLAFPFGKRLDRGMTSAGIYAFLPTETVTNLPFIIQADFLLPSSRETILWDDKWNQGILDCVPSAFVDAFISLVKSNENAPPSSLASMFVFLPVETSSQPKLNVVRDTIKEKMLQQSIILSESHSNQKFFHKPSEVGRLMPAFWKILLKAKEQGAKLHGLSSHGKHILHSSFDVNKYNDVLKFLDIKFVDYDWYPKCIGSCNLVMGVKEDVYVELLYFLAKNWGTHFNRGSMKSIQLLKYVDASGDVSLLTMNEATNGHSYSLCRSQHSAQISWLIDWSKGFIHKSRLAFLPMKLQECCQGVDVVLNWMRDHVNVETLNVSNFANRLQNSLRTSGSALVLVFTHFLYHSSLKRFLTEAEVKHICSRMPVVDRYGAVSVQRKGLLVPAEGSKWVDLLGSNPWKEVEFVELSEEYMHSGKHVGQFTPLRELIKFLQDYAGAADIPDICPPNSSFSTVSGPLTKENAFLLLSWIKNLRSRGTQIPKGFLGCIENGSWLRVTVSGSAGYRSPAQSFLPSSSWGNLLQNGSDMVDIPLVDQLFYDNKISLYQDELKVVGVMTEYGQACKFIGRHLMSMAAEYNLTKTKVIGMLHFIRFLREKYLQVDEFINSVKGVKWVQTSCGYRSPVETVLYSECWEAASAISQIPFMDQEYYGKDILGYKNELELLGLMVDLNENYQIVIDHVKSAASLNSLNPKSLICALKCINSSCKSEKLVASLKGARCLKTNMGYLPPAECFLFDDQWGCLFKVFEDFPLIHTDFYGSDIFQYKEILRKIAVVVNFDGVIESFCARFQQKASSKSFTKDNAFSFIACYSNLKNALQTLPERLRKCIQETKWLRTRLGDWRSPKECILFCSDWQPISQITLLPFVDDGESCYGEGIYRWKDELKSMGVVTDLSEGSHFVLSHVCFPKDPKDITPASVISLLSCIKTVKLEGKDSSLEASLRQIRQKKWLKTSLGYMRPEESLLLDKERSLKLSDGPFIDEEYYRTLSCYKTELATLGVIVDSYSSVAATALLSSHVESLTEFAKIERIYEYLSDAKWKPATGADTQIWFPTSSNDGMWVSPKECVLHDVNGMFKSRLHVLDQTSYKPTMFMFFSNSFDVKSKPSTDDFCSLWKDWEKLRREVSLDECCALWEHVIKSWNKKTDKTFIETVYKIPAVSGESSDILLVNKQDVFIPDDLLLKDLFEKSSSRALFVWCPKKASSSVTHQKLFDIYANIGVKKISESVRVCEQSDLKCEEWKQVKPKDVFIVKGFIMLILGFLADPELNIEVKSRLGTVKELLSADFFEMPEPITMSYSLQMTSGDIVKVSTCQMVCWQRESSKFFSLKLDRSGGYKSVVEYALMFSQVVSQGLLWDKEDLVPRLSELIKFGFLMDFDEDAVAYFMKSKNLQIFAEDEEFLSSAFPAL